MILHHNPSWPRLLWATSVLRLLLINSNRARLKWDKVFCPYLRHLVTVVWLSFWLEYKNGKNVLCGGVAFVKTPWVLRLASTTRRGDRFCITFSSWPKENEMKKNLVRGFGARRCSRLSTVASHYPEPGGNAFETAFQGIAGHEFSSFYDALMHYSELQEEDRTMSSSSVRYSFGTSHASQLGWIKMQLAGGALIKVPCCVTRTSPQSVVVVWWACRKLAYSIAAEQYQLPHQESVRGERRTLTATLQPMRPPPPPLRRLQTPFDS